MNQRKNRQHFFNLICMASIAFAVLCLLTTVPTFAEDKAQK